MDNFQDNLADVKWAEGKMRKLEKYSEDDDGGNNGLAGGNKFKVCPNFNWNNE